MPSKILINFFFPVLKLQIRGLVAVPSAQPVAQLLIPILIILLYLTWIFFRCDSPGLLALQLMFLNLSRSNQLINVVIVTGNPGFFFPNPYLQPTTLWVFEPKNSQNGPEMTEIHVCAKQYFLLFGPYLHQFLSVLDVLGLVLQVVDTGICTHTCTCLYPTHNPCGFQNP